jgi:site-specific DNA recombinase
MKRAAIYLRDKNPEGYSIEAQRETCRAKAVSLDAQVVGEYIDVSAERPKLRALIERARTAPDFDCIIVYRVDRLGRKLEDYVTIHESLEAASVELVSVTEVDGTPLDRLVDTVLAAAHEYHTNLTRGDAR